MRSLFFYVLRQIIGPFLLFTLVLTLVIWMTQSLRLLDIVINRGQSAVLFSYLTMLMLPIFSCLLDEATRLIAGAYLGGTSTRRSARPSASR